MPPRPPTHLTYRWIQAKLPKGTPLTARGPVEGTWWKVTTKGRTGWISEKYITDAPKSGFLTSSSVNLRSGPSKSHGVVKVLPARAPVTALGPAQGNWWEVKSQGRTGWVSLTYISPVSVTPLLTSSRVNLRSGPGTSHAIITKLSKSTPLTARGQVKGNWWKVTTKGRTGWIHVSYLHAAPKSGYTTTSRLNLRTGASKSGRIIKTLPKGVAVKHTGAAHGNWWKVTSQGKTGWVSISHIRRGTPKKPTQPDCRKAKCIALTFDDGPGAHTNRLLNILSDEKVPATFFLVGNKVDARSSVVKKMARAGHEVASHTWSHPSLPGLSNVAIKRQVRLTDAAIKRATGEVPSLLRPPYGARNPRVDKAVGKPLILWDVDTRDWEHKNPKKTISISLRDTRRGSIILMHDVHSTTVDAVPQLIKRLRSRGYTFVTVTTLLSQTKLTPGSLHYRAK